MQEFVSTTLDKIQIYNIWVVDLNATDQISRFTCNVCSYML